MLPLARATSILSAVLCLPCFASPATTLAGPPLVTASPAPALCRGLLDQALDRELTPEVVAKLQNAGTLLLTFPQTPSELEKTHGYALLSLAAVTKSREELPWVSLNLVEKPDPTATKRPRNWVLPAVFPGRTVRRVHLTPGAPPSPTPLNAPEADATFLQKGYFFIPLEFLIAPERLVELAIRWGKSGSATVLAKFPLNKDQIPKFLQKTSRKKIKALLREEKLPDAQTIVGWLRRDECF